MKTHGREPRSPHSAGALGFQTSGATPALSQGVLQPRAGNVLLAGLQALAQASSLLEPL